MPTKILIAYVDGIGTGNLGSDEGATLINAVVAPLTKSLRDHGHLVRPVRVAWPASMAGVGGSKSWDQAAAEGEHNLDELVRAIPEEKVILVAYSGGNKVVHDWLDHNPDQLDRVLAVGLVSDPFRPRDRQQDGWATQGWGIAGERLGPIPKRTFWTTVPGDVISDALPDSFLRTPADVGHVLPGAFVHDLTGHLRDNNLQLAWQIGLFRKNPLAWFQAFGPRLDRARLDVHGYLTGQHNEAYRKPFAGGPALVDRLAATLSWAARKNLAS